MLEQPPEERRLPGTRARDDDLAQGAGAYDLLEDCAKPLFEFWHDPATFIG